MATALNKRQQARNERTLQELIKTVPGNGQCADCGARNPGWASWSLGIFLCMRCAALHRKLGTHISKVKSLSMDKWDNAQVDNMKRIGNTESNKAYNPRNVKPQIPIDIDEVDSTMERFIRQKYEQRAFLNDSRTGSRQNTGSTSSAEDRPPPLPPKPTKRFGFGLAKSSTFPRNVTPPVSPGLGGFGEDSSPPRMNKPSRVFGSNISTSGDGLESKLATLRDMGFPDEKRNATVLKGLNGNLDRAVEALIRLGEQNSSTSRGHTPTPPTKGGPNGISIDRTYTAPASTTFGNPFDALDAAPPATTAPQQQPQQPQPGPLQTQQLQYGGQAATQATSPSNPYNPFLQQAQQAPQGAASHQQQQHFAQQQQQSLFGQQLQSLDQSFQGMQLSNQQPQQPLFPNHTGGYGQTQSPQYSQTNPFHQSFTPPPMPQIPQQYSALYQSQQQQFQPMTSPIAASNPFLKSARSQMFTPPPPSTANPFDPPPSQALNPFIVMPNEMPPPPVPAGTANPWQTQQPQQQQHPVAQAQAAQTMVSNPWQSQPQQQQSGFQAQTAQMSAPNPWQNQQTQQPQQTEYQAPPGTFDKNSILALYNYPQLAPPRPDSAQPVPAQATASPPAVSVPGSMNPFAPGTSQSGGGAQQPTTLQSSNPVSQQAPGTRHVSNESVDFAGLMGGRHSPDAFSGLSSSFRR